MTEPDFVVVNPAIGFGRYNAVVMRWNQTEQEYFVFRISQALKKTAAEALARSWAAAGRMEVR